MGLEPGFPARETRSNKERQRLQLLASVARAPLCEVRRVRYILNGNIAIWHETLMEQWVQYTAKWHDELFFFFFGVYRVLENSSLLYSEYFNMPLQWGLCITLCTS